MCSTFVKLNIFTNGKSNHAYSTENLKNKISKYSPYVN